MTSDLGPVTGSFRDPGGRVLICDGRVFRTVMPSAAIEFNQVEETGLLNDLVESGALVGWTRVSKDIVGTAAENAEIVLEHTPLPFISHPYEWSFGALKAAALLHLDIQLQALEKGVVLSDASAYNIQFNGPDPVFIDHLSFKPYRDGMYWKGHRQFCEQFLNPLVLNAYRGIPHHHWYRGSLEGVKSVECSAALPWLRKLAPNVLTNIVLPARFESRAQRRSAPGKGVNRGIAGALQEKKFPLSAYRHMLTGLRMWISKLTPLAGDSSIWKSYASANSYLEPQAEQKAAFVACFTEATKPQLLWDMGCNTGDYSCVALEAGADLVIGFEYDLGALDGAFRRAQDEKLRFLPLYLDIANPSPSQGWRQAERAGLNERRQADGVIALALIHHMCIGRNIPLESAIDWLVDLAPQGIIEFVPKSDPMAQELLMLREDIFDDYDTESFKNYLGSRAEIVASERITGADRELFWYKRK